MPTQSYEIEMESTSRLLTQTLRFTMSPNLWTNHALPQVLNWQRVKFEPASVELVPSNQLGVYSFVVEPSIANFNLAYLLYVGKTTRNFQCRFREYLRHEIESTTNRLLVQHMLRTWTGHLSFYYATIYNPAVVKSVEDELIAAFKPPVNLAYPARVSTSFRVLDRLG